MAETAKIHLMCKATKHERYREITLKDGSTHNIPESTITGYNPNTLVIEVETFILIQKNIPFKLT